MERGYVYMGDERCNIDHIIDILSIPTRGGGKRLDCPICALEGGTAGNGTIGILPEKQYFSCFRCGAKGNGVHMYGLFKYGYSKDQIEEDKNLKRQLFKEIVSGGNPQKTHPYSGNVFKKEEFVTKEVKHAPLKERDKTYSSFLNMISLSDEHREELRRRGLRDSDIYANGYKSVPKMGYSKIPRDLRREACDLLGVPGFFKKDDVWSLQKTKSGFFIPARDLSDELPRNRFGSIQGLQIRFDTVKEGDTRYKWLSSRNMDSGCGAETYVHFVGVPQNAIILTEGPLKADIIYRFLEVPVAAVPGVNSQQKLEEMLPRLWAVGVRKIKTAFDMDYLQNINVQESYIKLVKLLRRYGFGVERLLWDADYKGLDDYLLNVYKHRGGKIASNGNPEAM